MVALSDGLSQTIKDFVLDGVELDDGPYQFPPDPFWNALRATGTELWLDTGDIEDASQYYREEFSALTTNNSLLNKEIQKGIYDDFIPKANDILEGLSTDERVFEIAFMLNARHGLKLVQTFGGMVSVELHTGLSHDVNGIVEYGKRFYEICPTNFIVKVPLTPAGLLGTRKLRDAGIPVNFTLGFSARQNVFATAIARASYVNVFLGRLNAFVADNKLGDGNFIGEKTTLASLRAIKEVGAANPEPTKQIAASMRIGEQVALLAGVDVFTMPTKVAKEAHETLGAIFNSRVEEEYQVSFADGVNPDAATISKLWDVSDNEKKTARALGASLPATADDLTAAVRDSGIHDLFPEFSDEELATIADAGKIPKYTQWAPRIEKGEVAVDALMNHAALLMFTADQKALDARVRGIIEK